MSTQSVSTGWLILPQAERLCQNAAGPAVDLPMLFRYNGPVKGEEHMLDKPTEAARATLAPQTNWRARIWKYIEVTKPSTVALLVFTCIGSMVVAGGIGGLSLSGWALALIAITAGCAAADTLT